MKKEKNTPPEGRGYRSYRCIVKSLNVNKLLKFFGYIFTVLFLVCSCAKKEQDQDNPFQLPLQLLSCTDTPLVKVSVEGHEFLLKIDLGASYDLTLRQNALDLLKEKSFEGESDGRDIRGNQYHNPQFRIPEIKLRKLIFENAIATQEDPFFITHGSKLGKRVNKKRIDEQLRLIDGRIGNGLFHSSVCYLDFSHSRFCVGLNMEDILKWNPLDGYSKIPFTLKHGLVCVDLMTNQGKKTFILDTGANRSALNSNEKHLMNACRLKIEGLRCWTLRVLDFPEPLSDIDGILGMDFFREYAVCLDFPNQTLYLKRI